MHSLTPLKICVTAYPEMELVTLPTDDSLTARISPCYIPIANIRMLDRNGVTYERLTFDPYGWWGLVRQVQC